MYCKHCGKEISNEISFCPHCGGRVKKPDVDSEIPKSNMTEGIETSANETKTSPVHRTNSPPLSGNPKKKVGIIAAFIVVAAALIAVLLYQTMPRSINLNRYLTVTFEGYDTVGKAYVDMDTEELTKDHGKYLLEQMEEDSGYTFWYGELSEEVAVDIFLSEYVNGGLDQEDALSNGDEITFTWNCFDDDAKEDLKVNLKYTDESYTVSDLTEAEVFDPFEDLVIEFSGVSPNGVATVENNAKQSAAQSLSFDLSQESGLKNGDEITVSIYDPYDDVIQDCITEFGVIPSPTEKTYTVSGLESYVTEADQISEDALSDMKKKAEEVLLSEQNYQPDSTEWKSATYLGNYLLTLKESQRDSVWGADENRVYLVYRITVRNWYSSDTEQYDEETTYYWYCGFTNISYKESGNTIVDVEQYFTPWDTVLISPSLFYSWSYYGYETLDDLYQEVVQSESENYDSEETIDESVADEPLDSTASSESAVQTSAEEAMEETSPLPTDGMIFSDSSSRLLSADEVKDLSQEDLRSAVNEIYARAGYTFSDQSILAYYQQFSWYTPTISAGDFTENNLSEIERANVALIQSYRNE